MTATAMPKWDDEMTQTLHAGYDADNSEASVEALMETLDRSKRSVIGKLVSEKIYVAPEKPEVKKNEGPTKAEILEDIAGSGFDVDGFEGATKAALTRLLDTVAG